MSVNKLNYAQGNNISDTLSTSIGSTDTSIPVSTSSKWSSNGGKVIIDRNTTSEEIVYITGVSGASLTVPSGGRGAEGTTAVGHNAGATIESVPTAGDWNDTIDSLLNVVTQTTGALDTTKVVDLTTAQTLTNKTLTAPVINGAPSGSTFGTDKLSSTLYAADSGSANTYVVTLTPIPASYTNGMVVRFLATNANTGASTLNVNSLGAKTIKKLNGSTDLVSGDIAASQLVTCVYDGTNFQMQSQTGNAASVAPEFVDNGTTITGQMLIQTGRPTPVAGNGTGSQDFVVTFTTAFKTSTTPRVVANPDMTVGSGSSNAYGGFSSLSNTGFTFRMQLVTGTLLTNSTYSFDWIAIGQA